MFRADNLVIYKNRPALVREARDRIEIRTEDGSSVKVRDKDIRILHEGPVKTIPGPSSGGDFDTARRMLAGDSESPVRSSWEELAELVFGLTGPGEVMACFECASGGLLFVLDDGLPWARGDADLLRETARREKKSAELAERTAFILRAKAVKRGGRLEKTESDARFIGEIEALALGKTEKSRIAVDLGIKETPEAAHAFLVACGWWEIATNPHPSRSGCPLKAPLLALGDETTSEASRRDLISFTSWAIDNEWSKDPDDAIGWDGKDIWIHVADPAATILPESPADREALSRGATLYLPELTSPMLPDETLERYGLGLAPTSPALSFRVELNAEGYVSEVEVLSSRVRVRRTHYGEADRLLAKGDADLAAFDRIAALRTKRRTANGSVEIAIPEVRVHVESGEVVIHRPGSFRSSEIVREFMLLAGEAAAIWAFKRGLAFPFYSQEAPSIPGEKGQDENSLSLQFSRRRGMRAGMLGPSPGAHRGLGLPFYAQTTSPLRRYQDLLGHMQIHAILEGRHPLDADEVGKRCALAQASQAPNRQAERASELHWCLVWLSRHPDWKGEAILVSSSGQGLWLAYIPEIGLEAKLRLSGEHSLDETIIVKVSRIDIPLQEIAFEVCTCPKTD